MRFDALDISIEINRAVAPLARVIGRQDPDMARQIRRAAQSIPANLAEGRRRMGRDRIHHFRIAAGSAAELVVHLRSAEAWGFVSVKARAQPLSA